MQPTRGFIEQLSRWEEKMFGSLVTDISEPEYWVLNVTVNCLYCLKMAFYRQFSVNINIFIPFERHLSINFTVKEKILPSSVVKQKDTRSKIKRLVFFIYTSVEFPHLVFWLLCSLRIWRLGRVGVCRLVLQILTLFQTKNCYFPQPFSDQTTKIHTRFQTAWALGRNYVIMAYIIAQTKSLFKCISNSHISNSFIFIWNWNEKYVHTLPYVPDCGACEFASKLSLRLFFLPLTAPGSFFSTFADLKHVFQSKVEEEAEVSEVHGWEERKMPFFPLVFFPMFPHECNSRLL